MKGIKKALAAILSLAVMVSIAPQVVFAAEIRIAMRKCPVRRQLSFQTRKFMCMLRKGGNSNFNR